MLLLACEHSVKEFLQFDEWNLEARLSLRATRPDPFQAFADVTAVGSELCGPVTALAPFGAFVEVSDGIEGLLHLGNSLGRPRLRSSGSGTKSRWSPRRSTASDAGSASPADQAHPTTDELRAVS